MEYWGFDVEGTAEKGAVCGEAAHVLFDYNRRNPLNADASTVKIKDFTLD
jgi:hypothetical protein